MNLSEIAEYVGAIMVLVAAALLYIGGWAAAIVDRDGDRFVAMLFFTFILGAGIWLIGMAT